MLSRLLLVSFVVWFYFFSWSSQLLEIGILLTLAKSGIWVSQVKLKCFKCSFLWPEVGWLMVHTVVAVVSVSQRHVNLCVVFFYKQEAIIACVKTRTPVCVFQMYQKICWLSCHEASLRHHFNSWLINMSSGKVLIFFTVFKQLQ
jgi:hypothetical protein